MEYVWWYALANERKGPVSAAQLEQLLRAGTIDFDTWVWRSGHEDWLVLWDVAELAYLQESTPPALPGESARARVRTMPLAGPWRRCCARLLDVALLSIPAGFLLGAALALLAPSFADWVGSPDPGTRLALGFMLVPLALLTEAVVFGLFGTTPGKFLFGIRIVTASGACPGFTQYLKRTLALYWRGMALSLPLVSLITMLDEYRRVRNGQSASYDGDQFRVKAPEMGTVGLVTAITLVIGLISLNSVLQPDGFGLEKKISSGSEWTNPVTARRATIPAGWKAGEQKSDRGEAVYTFSSGNGKTVAFISQETAADSMLLEEYERTWLAAAHLKMDRASAEPVEVRGCHGLQMKGVVSDDRTRRVHATLVKAGHQFWRVVMVGVPGTEPNSEESKQLRKSLLETMGPDVLELKKAA
ncbi:RDD family protein [Variovorax sp. J22R133]|uniref:RDD family protein n=1 Tax=Variovorax brevis TaxID=3053503 RepID=UPI0025788BFF|nr:RDD family protein [Variovorax sp. J22R133]MDM0113850.1 RDD family protein [Variovorax sp. J22R133]